MKAIVNISKGLTSSVNSGQIIAIQQENERLRAALAQSDQPCAYCTLSVEDWNKCQSGFPGCARADDAMGCPELGASLELQENRLLIRNLEANIRYWHDKYIAEVYKQ